MGAVSSVASIIGKNKEAIPARAYLGELQKGDGAPNDWRAFQYYPATVEDSKGVDYIEKTVIGSSHPIYQWIHGSKRSISFDAVFSTDFEPVNKLDVLGLVTSFIKSPAAAAISTLTKPKPDPYDPIKGTGKNIDIPSAIAWFRSKLYPDYAKNKVVQPPPKLLLVLEGAGITSFVGTYELGSIPCIMSRCDVSYEAFFRDGTPRVATLSFEFIEIVQVGKSWSWVSASKFKPAYKNFTYGKDKKTGSPKNSNFPLGFSKE